MGGPEEQLALVQLTLARERGGHVAARAGLGEVERVVAVGEALRRCLPALRLEQQRAPHHPLARRRRLRQPRQPLAQRRPRDERDLVRCARALQQLEQRRPACFALVEEHHPARAHTDTPHAT
eukprot:1062169-Rhodomonas_salina.2